MSTDSHLYTEPHQMFPMLPGERRLGELRELAAVLISRAKDLPAAGEPPLGRLLRDVVRPMNAYYSNKIEGLQADPILIERALHQDFSSGPDEASRQRLALAHIETERWGEAAYPRYVPTQLFTASSVQGIHEHLYQQLLPEDRIQHWEDGREEHVEPGRLRSAFVKVGSHVPPAPEAIPRFLEEWSRQYQPARSDELAVIALMAAHHRLAWIHPFADGNGRVTRLHTHFGLSGLGLTNDLWSLMRGLAQQQEQYYRALAGADAARAGDLDGRGQLSERGLVEFIRFMLDVCLDQVQFMGQLLQLDAFEAGLKRMLATESARHETRNLRQEALTPLHHLTTEPSLEHHAFKALMGLPESDAAQVMVNLFELGIITSPSPEGPVSLALPLRLLGYLLPHLWPEAECSGS